MPQRSLIMNCFKRILPAFIIALFLSCAGDFKEITDEERQARLPQSSSSEQSSSSASEEASSSSVWVSSESSSSPSSSSEAQSSSGTGTSSSSEGSSSSVLTSSSSIITSSSSSAKDCNDIVFNPDNRFCYDGATYNKCDGMPYNPTTHICIGNSATRAKCNEIEYNPLTQGCCNDTVIFALSKHECINNEISWIYDTLTDSRDNKTYKTIEIGNQIWMAQNLNYKGGRCHQGNGAATSTTTNTDNCNIYGSLYSWIIATAEGFCPEGWHLPSDDEWTILTDYVGESAGTKLKATSYWSSSGNGTDEHGFSALPGGYHNTTQFVSLNGNFNNLGNTGYWWSSSTNEADTTQAWYRSISASDNDVIRGSARKTNTYPIQYSVRCIKN